MTILMRTWLLLADMLAIARRAKQHPAVAAARRWLAAQLHQVGSRLELAGVDLPRVCQVCGRTGVLMLCTATDGGPLSREQWLAHAERASDESREYGADKTNAWYHAERVTEQAFGPCPPEDSESRSGP